MLQETETTKKICYIFSKESCFYIFGNKNAEKHLYFSENGTAPKFLGKSVKH